MRTRRSILLAATIAFLAGAAASSPALAGGKNKASNGFEHSGVKLKVSKNKSYNKSKSKNSGRSSKSYSSRNRSSYDHHDRHDYDRHHGSYRHHDHDDSLRLSFSLGSSYRYGSAYRYGSRYGHRSYVYRYDPFCDYPRTSVYRPWTSSTYRYIYTPTPTVNTYVNTNANLYEVWQEDVASASPTPTTATVADQDYPEYNPGPDAPQPAIAETAAPAETVARDPGALVDDGWDALGRGDFATARDQFAEAAGAEPGASRGKVGFAVASAMLDRTDAATWAMRRAFATQPDTIGFASFSTDAAAALDDLSEDLRDDIMAVAPDKAADAWFLIAAIDYLRHDTDAAAEAADAATVAGDDSESLETLKSLLTN